MHGCGSKAFMARTRMPLFINQLIVGLWLNLWLGLHICILSVQYIQTILVSMIIDLCCYYSVEKGGKNPTALHEEY